MVKDVDATIRFYHDILGFELLTREKEEDQTYWAKMSLLEFSLSFKEENRLRREVTFMKDRPIGGSTARSICWEGRNAKS